MISVDVGGFLWIWDDICGFEIKFVDVGGYMWMWDDIFGCGMLSVVV